MNIIKYHQSQWFYAMSRLWLDIFKMLHVAPTLKQHQLFGAELYDKLITIHTFALIRLYKVDLTMLAKN